MNDTEKALADAVTSELSASQMATKFAPLTSARDRASPILPRTIPRPAPKLASIDHLDKAVQDVLSALVETRELGTFLVGEANDDGGLPLVSLGEGPLINTIHTAADRLQLLARDIRNEIARIRVSV